MGVRGVGEESPSWLDCIFSVRDYSCGNGSSGCGVDERTIGKGGDSEDVVYSGGLPSCGTALIVLLSVLRSPHTNLIGFTA